jgi:hypothetical protein
MPRIDRELLGEAGLLDATTAIAIGIPATPGGGKQWQLSRAALLHSLACLGSCLRRPDRADAQPTHGNPEMEGTTCFTYRDCEGGIAIAVVSGKKT